MRVRKFPSAVRSSPLSISFIIPLPPGNNTKTALGSVTTSTRTRERLPRTKISCTSNDAVVAVSCAVVTLAFFLTTRATAGLSQEIVLARACDGHAATIASPTPAANVVFGITCPAPRIQPPCSLEYRATRSGRRDRSAPAPPQRPPVSHETRHPYRPQPASRDRSPHHRP